jgi:membrane protease YdiL (CAAX protease family)
MQPELDPDAGASPLQPMAAAPVRTISRATALFEVLLCSGYPTQIAVAASIAALGVGTQGDGGRLNAVYVVALSLVDTAVLVALILGIMAAHGERPHTLFVGSRSPWREAALGVPLILGALTLAIGLLGTLQLVAPWLHTVARNPLQDLLQTPRDALMFAVVVVVAGGVREELQRAFLLHRFEEHLGGARVGLLTTSVSFGAGHLLQGADAAIATGLLGAFWAAVYLRRRSVVAPMVSHAGFNLLQLAQFLVISR